MIDFFLSAFNFHGLSWTLILLAIVIALIFGVLWIFPYWIPILKRPWLWIVAIISAVLTWSAIAFIQIPLQTQTGNLLLHFWNQATLTRWLALSGIPQILLSGLVQEGSKLIPVVICWWRSGWRLTPKFGLLIGAAAGAGFGVFEAVWVHNTIFASGWTWQTVESGGFTALLGFWERFFTIALHIAVSAIAGYGLAKRMGWQFYLIAAFLHSTVNYSIVLLQLRLLTAVQVEIYIAVISIVITGIALWLRWRKLDDSDSEEQKPLG